MQRVRRYLSQTRTALILLLTLLVVLLNIVGFILYHKNSDVEESERWVVHTYEVIAETQFLFGQLQDMVTAQRGFLLSGDDAFLSPYREASAGAETTIDHLLKLTSDRPEQTERYTSWKAGIAAQRALLAGQIAMRQERGSFSLTLQDHLASKKLMDISRTYHNDALTLERKLLADREREQNAQREQYTRTFIISSVIAGLVLLLANGFLFFASNRQRETESHLDRARDDLVVTNDRLELALKGTSDGLFDWKVDSDEMFYSPRFKEMLGYSDDELPNSLNALMPFIHPDDKDEALKVAHDYLDGKLPEYRNSYRIRHRNGSWHWHLTRGIAQRDAAGKATRLIGAHTDITDLKQLEESLRASNKELEGFTYIASHDLRSPLVNLKGFAGEIERGIALLAPFTHNALEKLKPDNATAVRIAIDEDLPEALGFIKNSVARMDKLTTAILELSRLGRRELKREEIDTPALVERCLGTLQHIITRTGTSTEIGELPNVVADAVSLEQVFGNVIDNSLKYLDPARPGHLRISGRRGASETIFTISDNGRGIAPADRQKVFEIFRRAGNNEAIPGEGMGMPYVRTLLRRHGGDIWFDSAVNEGTTFMFTIAHHQKETAA